MTHVLMPAGINLPQAATQRDRVMNQAVKDMYLAIRRRIQDEIQDGAFADMPASTGLNRFYWSTDTDALYFDSATGWIRIGSSPGWTLISKSADQSKSSDTALAADTELKFAMAANTRYRVRALIFYTTGATPDFKFATSGPASPTLVILRRQHVVAAGTADVAAVTDYAYSGAVALTSGAGSGWIMLDGYVLNGANAGDFEFQWAQNTSNIVPAVVLQGSWLEYEAC